MERDPERPALDRESFERIVRVIYNHTGIRLAPGKEYFVAGRLGGLLAEWGCASWAELPEKVEEGPRERVEAFVQAVVTHETSFFRDRVPFRVLRQKVLPCVASTGGVVRIWSAGCSTGQEPYSILMALWDRVEAGLDLQVWASDLSDRALDTARRARYEAWELGRGVGEVERERFFEPEGPGVWRVKEALRRRVRFGRFNLLRDPPPVGPFQVVCCRNVAIYFDRTGKKYLYRVLGRVLGPGGYLFLGASETMFPPVPWFQTLYFERMLVFRRTTGAVP